jgi:hypothetical protein
MTAFTVCFWCKCPAKKQNLTSVTFAAEKSQVPECARKQLLGTLFVVNRHVCQVCIPKLSGLVKIWEGGKQ